MNKNGNIEAQALLQQEEQEINRNHIDSEGENAEPITVESVESQHTVTHPEQQIQPTEATPLLTRPRQLPFDQLVEFKINQLPGRKFKIAALVGGVVMGYIVAPFYLNGVKNFNHSDTAERIHKLFGSEAYEYISSVFGNCTINSYAGTDSFIEIRDMINAAREPGEILDLKKKASLGYSIVKWGGGIVLITLTSATLYAIANFISGNEADHKPLWLNLLESSGVGLSTLFLNFLSVNLIENGFKNAQQFFHRLSENLSCGKNKSLTAKQISTTITDAFNDASNQTLADAIKASNSYAVAALVATPNKARKNALDKAGEATLALFKIPVGTAATAAVLFSNVGLNCDSTEIFRNLALKKLTENWGKDLLATFGGSVILAGGQNILCILGGYTIGSAIVELGSASFMNIGKVIANLCLKLYGSDTRYPYNSITKDTLINLAAFTIATAALLNSGGTATYLATKCATTTPFSHMPAITSEAGLNFIYHFTNIFNIFWAQKGVIFLSNFGYELVFSNEETKQAVAIKKAAKAISYAGAISTLSSIFRSNPDTKQKVAALTDRSADGFDNDFAQAEEEVSSFTHTARKSACTII